MAFIGLGLFLLAFVFAGFAMAPLFNRFLPPERKCSGRGCAWIIPAIASAFLGASLLLNVPHPDPDHSEWNEHSVNMGE